MFPALSSMGNPGDWLTLPEASSTPGHLVCRDDARNRVRVNSTHEGGFPFHVFTSFIVNRVLTLFHFLNTITGEYNTFQPVTSFIHKSYINISPHPTYLQVTPHLCNHEEPKVQENVK